MEATGLAGSGDRGLRVGRHANGIVAPSRATPGQQYPSLSQVVMNLGALENRAGRWDVGLATSLRALPIAKAAHNSFAESAALLNAAVACKRLKQFDRATEYLDAA